MSSDKNNKGCHFFNENFKSRISKFTWKVYDLSFAGFLIHCFRTMSCSLNNSVFEVFGKIILLLWILRINLQAQLTCEYPLFFAVGESGGGGEKTKVQDCSLLYSGNVIMTIGFLWHCVKIEHVRGTVLFPDWNACSRVVSLQHMNKVLLRS